MNEKLSFQNIVDTLARKAGVQKKVAETFSKAFFDTIVEAVSAGDVVKIKGLGTFKLVEVGDRESVNVSTGMRFVIPGYKKLTFTAEDHVAEVLNPQAKTSVQVEESAKVAEPTKVAEPEKVEVPTKVAEPVKSETSIEVETPKKEEDIDTLIQVPEPEQVETPQDAFAGIDMLISTPESVDDLRQQYEEAKAKMETAVEEARKANAEKMRLEKLLERLEQNVEPEVVAHTEDTESPANASPVETAEDTKPISLIPVAAVSGNPNPSVETSEEEKRQEAFNRVMTEPSHTQEEEVSSKPSGNKRFWLTTLIILLLAVLGVFVYLIHRNIEAVEKVQTTEQTTQPAKAEKPAQPAKPTKPAAPKTDKDSLAKAQKADGVKVAAKPQKDTSKPDVQKPDVKKTDAQKSDTKKQDTKKPEAQKPAKEERPKTHRMQRGESLTRVSQKYYGTKDSVRAILRVNTFANPDNIPVGAVVKLP
ncbi:MAG: HU family DNA-binding protein [Bacteroidales bacterium]|nr:HU family DNA-binding protein [Bacteroidales bacterium]